MTDLLDLLTATNLALSGGIALVLLARLPARRFFGPRAAYALWLIPLLTAAASMLPAGRAPVTIPSETLPSSISRVLPQVSDFTTGQWAPAPDESGWPASVILMTIWVAGVAISLGVLAMRQHRFVTALDPLRRAADVDTAIWYSDAMAVGPALVGVFRPRIVLPGDFASRFTPGEQRLVIAHELAHLRAGDAQTNAIVALLRSANWFNPLVHLASRLIRFDQELARDLTKSVFLSVGESEEDFMVEDFRAIVERLESREYDSLRLDTHVFEGENHASGIGAAMSRGVRSVLGAH